MESHDGLLTGHLTTLPPIGEARALVLADYAAQHGLSLEESVAYADSASDLAMLEAVGFPVAVNPESRLSAIARRRGPARRALGQGRGWVAPPTSTRAFRRPTAQSRDGPMSTLLFERSLPRFAAARVSSHPSGRGGVPVWARCASSSAYAALGAVRRLGPRQPRPFRHLRIGPRHAGRAHLA